MVICLVVCYYLCVWFVIKVNNNRVFLFRFLFGIVRCVNLIFKGSVIFCGDVVKFRCCLVIYVSV